MEIEKTVEKNLPLTPDSAHISVALVMGGEFGQFADPLDWIARKFGLDVKVDRMQLMESLAVRGGGTASAGRAKAEALGNDKKTHFRLQLLGRCENKPVGLCLMSFHPTRLSIKMIEESATDIVVLNGGTVLGVQATHGASAQTLDGLAAEDALIRLMPINIFNRSYFQSKIALIEGNRKLRVIDAGDALLVQLVKPWLFYDVPSSSRSRKAEPNLLPF